MLAICERLMCSLCIFEFLVKFLSDSVMDETESESSEVQETERVERLTVASSKPVVLHQSGQAVTALLDDSSDSVTEHGFTDENGSSELLLAENNETIVDSLTLADTDGVSYNAEDSCPAFENVAEILSQSEANENGLSATYGVESATVPSYTSSFVDNTVEDVANSDEMLHLSCDNGDDVGGHSDTSLSRETAVVHDENETLLNSTEEALAVDDVQASAADIHSTSVDSSVTESYDKQMMDIAELSIRDAAESSTSDQPVSETSNDWLNILGHDRLRKRIVHAGQEHCRPQRGQLVTVKCSGRLEDGTEIDRHDELKLVLGDVDFIHAFDLCISLMDKDEKCELVSDAQYAYGAIGREPDVPPNATVTYEIELLNFEDQPSLLSVPVCERLRLSNEKRERGNYLYARNDCIQAIRVYEKAIKIADTEGSSLSESASDLQLLLESRIKCFNNLAAAQLKIEAWDAAIQSCNNVLRVQPDNVKALFRKAKCLISRGEYDTAGALLRRALKLDQDNKTVQNELTRLEKKTKEQETHQRQLYKKMLGTASDETAAMRQEGIKQWQWYSMFGIAALVLSASVAAYRHFSHT